MRKVLFVFMAVSLVLMSVAPCGVSAEEPKKPNISMLLGTLDNPHWLHMKEAGERAGKELGANVTVLGVDKEGDASKQFSQMEDRLAAGDNAIVIAVMDSNALIPIIKQANQAKVILTAVDKTSKEGDIAAVVQTNNDTAGYMGAKWVAEQIGGKGKVLVLEGLPGGQVHVERRAGAHRAFGEYPGIEIVASLPADWETAKGQSVTEDTLTAHPDLAGIFACNDMMAVGAQTALKARQLDSKVVLCGLDGAAYALDMVADGRMGATVAQFPGRMGYLGVEYAIRALQGEKVPALVDSGEMLITKENVWAFRAGYFGS